MKHKNRLGKIMNREHWQKDDSMVVGNGLVCYSNFSYLLKKTCLLSFSALKFDYYIRLLTFIITSHLLQIFSLINFGSLSERYLHLHIITNIKLSENYSYTWNNKVSSLLQKQDRALQDVIQWMNGKYLFADWLRKSFAKKTFTFKRNDTYEIVSH